MGTCFPGSNRGARWFSRDRGARYAVNRPAGIRLEYVVLARNFQSTGGLSHLSDATGPARVQFHPESILTMEDKHGLQLLGNLLASVAALTRAVD